MIARRALVAAIALVLVSCESPRSRPPNVLLLTVDTLRPDHLGAWGSPQGTSPAIDRLAAQGTSFVTTIVPRGQTWPTLASLLTSQYPVGHGVRKNGQPFDSGFETLAGVLRNAGYTTGAMLANAGSAGWTGFDEILDRRARDNLVHEGARRWLRRHAGETFFLWVHYFEPHRPFDPTAPDLARLDGAYDGPIDGSIEQMKQITAEKRDLSRRDLEHLRARYAAEIRGVDRRIEGLLDDLDRLDLATTTLVVFTSDHGEELFARNHYFSHSASIYDTVLRAPLVFRWPGHVAAGEWREPLAETVDIAPTILELVRAQAPPTFEGISLAGVLEDATRSTREYAVSELEDRVVSLRTERHRFVHNPTDFDFPLIDEGVLYPIAVEELYVHDRDPGEIVNVAADDPEVVRRLRAKAKEWMDAHDWTEASRRHAAREVPLDVQESLRALGYAR